MYASSVGIFVRRKFIHWLNITHLFTLIIFLRATPLDVRAPEKINRLTSFLVALSCFCKNINVMYTGSYVTTVIAFSIDQ